MMMSVRATSSGLIPPPERGRVVAEGDRVGVSAFTWTPTRRAARADLPLAGGGIARAEDVF